MTTPSDNMTTVTCLFKQTRLRVTWWWRGENIGKSSLTDIILDKKLLLCQLKEKHKLRKKGRAQAAMFHLYLENTPSTISSSMFQDLSASWLPPLSFWIKSRVSAWTPLQRFVVHKSSVSVVLGKKKKKKKRGWDVSTFTWLTNHQSYQTMWVEYPSSHSLKLHRSRCINIQ